MTEALRALGLEVHLSRDIYPPLTPDIDWLPEVASKGWIILTKDAKISGWVLEVDAIRSAGAHVLVLGGTLNRTQLRDAVLAALPRIARALARRNEPLVRRITPDGRLETIGDFS